MFDTRACRFGEPDLAKDDRAWSLRQVLGYLKARPQMYLTHIIMVRGRAADTWRACLP